MSFEIATSKLDEISDVIDSLHKTPKYSNSGYAMVRCVDLEYGPLKLENTAKVTKETFEEYSRRYAPKKWDIIITRVGANFGVTSFVNDLEFCLGQNTAAIKPKINPRYFYYVLNSSISRHQMNILVAGAAQPTLSLKAIKNLDIPRLGYKIEAEIASILGALDDRITLLRETNSTLEAIAQALFKSWFVDFDPVHAKQQGREPEGMDANTAALFPDSLEESELGLVPMGWKWVNLDAIAVVIMGLSPKGDSYNYDGVGVPLINGPVEFGDYFPVQTKWTNSASKFANEGDLIFCVRGSTTGRRVVSDREYCIGRGVCAIRGNNDSANFIYQTINFGIDRLLNKTTGSVFPSLSGPDIKTFKVLNPTEALITAYENTTKSILHRIQANHRKAQTLANLRDTLLPRLISGQLRLPDSTTA